MMNCEYARKYYGVPAEIGRKVIVGGHPGIIAKDKGNYIGVLFDSDKPTKITPCHPTHMVEYGEIGKVRKMTRSQQRYREFLDSDWFEGTFAEWIGIYKKG